MSGWPDGHRGGPTRSGSLPRRREGARRLVPESPGPRSTGSDTHLDPHHPPHHHHPHMPPPGHHVHHMGSSFRPQSGTTQSSFSMSDDWLYQLEDRVTQTASSQGQLKGEFVLMQGRIEILEHQLTSERDRYRSLERDFHAFRSEVARFQQNVMTDVSTLRETLVFYKNVLDRHDIHFDLPQPIAEKLDYMNPLSRMGQTMHREGPQGVEVMSWVRDVQRTMPQMQQIELTLHPNPEDPSRYDLELASNGMGRLVVAKLSQDLHNDGLRKGDYIRYVEGAELSHATIPAAVALFRRRPEGTRVVVERENTQQSSRRESGAARTSMIATSMRAEGSVQRGMGGATPQQSSGRPRVGSFTSIDAPFDSGSSIRGFRAPAIRYESDTELASEHDPDNDSDDENKATYHAYMAQGRGQAGTPSSMAQSAHSQGVGSGSHKPQPQQQPQPPQQQQHRQHRLSQSAMSNSGSASGSRHPSFSEHAPPAHPQLQAQQGGRISSNGSHQGSNVFRETDNAGEEDDIPDDDSVCGGEDLEVMVQRHTTDSLGFGVRGIRDETGQTCRLFVASFTPGSPAERNENFKLGDEVVSVDGTPLSGLPYREMLNTLKSAANTFKLVISRARNPEKILRALERHHNETNPHRLALDALSALRSKYSDLLFQLCTLKRTSRDAQLGLTLGENTHLGAVIQGVKEGGLAAKTMQFHVGDVITNVNGCSIAGLSRADARKLLRESGDVLHIVHARPKKKAEPHTEL